MKFKVIKAFDWAYRGVEVVSYQENDSLETDDEDLIGVATKEGWIAKDSGDKSVKISNKAHAIPQKKTLLEKAINIFK